MDYINEPQYFKLMLKNVFYISKQMFTLCLDEIFVLTFNLKKSLDRVDRVTFAHGVRLCSALFPKRVITGVPPVMTD